jgi:hypothetical protein
VRMSRSSEFLSQPVFSFCWLVPARGMVVFRRLALPAAARAINLCVSGAVGSCCRLNNKVVAGLAVEVWRGRLWSGRVSCQTIISFTMCQEYTLVSSNTLNTLLPCSSSSFFCSAIICCRINKKRNFFPAGRPAGRPPKTMQFLVIPTLQALV